MTTNPLRDPTTRVGQGFMRMDRRIRQLEDQALYYESPQSLSHHCYEQTVSLVAGQRR